MEVKCGTVVEKAHALCQDIWAHTRFLCTRLRRIGRKESGDPTSSMMRRTRVRVHLRRTVGTGFLAIFPSAPASASAITRQRTTDDGGRTARGVSHSRPAPTTATGLSGAGRKKEGICTWAFIWEPGKRVGGKLKGDVSSFAEVIASWGTLAEWGVPNSTPIIVKSETRAGEFHESIRVPSLANMKATESIVVVGQLFQLFVSSVYQSESDLI